MIPSLLRETVKESPRAVTTATVTGEGVVIENRVSSSVFPLFYPTKGSWRTEPVSGAVFWEPTGGAPLFLVSTGKWE